MEILSFVLGIAFVVVVAAAIVAVYAFVKVNRLEKQIEEIQRQLSQEVERIWRSAHEEDKAIYDHINYRVRDIESQLDSRLDKLQNKKQLLKD
jgi:hypothetical protein